MSTFINPDFLLGNKFARELYHESAENLPIIDYHCHLIPQQVAENHKFADITEVWLGGDHYKWRALRGNGVDEDTAWTRITSQAEEAAGKNSKNGQRRCHIPWGIRSIIGPTSNWPEYSAYMTY